MHLRLQRSLAKILTLQLALNWPASLFLHSPVFRLLLDFGSPMPWRPVCPSILGSSRTLGGGANPSRKWRDPHSHVLYYYCCFASGLRSYSPSQQGVYEGGVWGSWSHGIYSREAERRTLVLRWLSPPNNSLGSRVQDPRSGQCCPHLTWACLQFNLSGNTLADLQRAVCVSLVITKPVRWLRKINYRKFLPHVKCPMYFFLSENLGG